jgi:hypothetical protein
MQGFMAVHRLIPKTIVFCSLVSLVPLSGYGQDLVRERQELTNTNNWTANRNPLLSRDSKAKFSKLFDPKLKLARSVGLVPSMGSVPRIAYPPSHTPISNVSWPIPSINTPVLPPKTASQRADRDKSGTNRWIAGLVGVGLTGAGVYLMATAPNPINQPCPLCSRPPIEPPTEPPTSGAHTRVTERKLHSHPPTGNIQLRLTGQQGAGFFTILAGVGFLYYAIAPD